MVLRRLRTDLMTGGTRVSSLEPRMAGSAWTASWRSVPSAAQASTQSALTMRPGRASSTSATSPLTGCSSLRLGYSISTATGSGPSGSLSVCCTVSGRRLRGRSSPCNASVGGEVAVMRFAIRSA